MTLLDRFTLLSHALCIVLDLCPHHPTLLQSLFEVTTSYGLYIQSSLLLESLLLLSFSPESSNTHTPYICHSAHSGYLVGLKISWVQGKLPLTSFLRIVGESLTLADTPASWSSPAFIRLVHDTCLDDSYHLFRVGSSLVDAMGHRTLLGKDEVSLSMRSPLHNWLCCISGPLRRDLSLWNYEDIAEFLDTCKHANAKSWHTKSIVEPHPYQNLMGLIVSMATQCILPSSQLPPFCQQAAVSFLKDITPLTSLYDHLVRLDLSPIIHLDNFVNKVQQRVKEYQTALRRLNLSTMEHSLLSCFLHHTENLQSTSTHQHTVPSLNVYRHELIEAIEEAEKRCFGKAKLWEVGSDTPFRFTVPIPPRRKPEAFLTPDSPGSSPFSSVRMLPTPPVESPSETQSRKRQKIITTRPIPFTLHCKKSRDKVRVKVFDSIISGANSRRTSIQRTKGRPVIHATPLRPYKIVSTSKPRPRTVDFSDPLIPSSDDLNLCSTV